MLHIVVIDAGARRQARSIAIAYRAFGWGQLPDFRQVGWDGEVGVVAANVENTSNTFEIRYE